MNVCNTSPEYREDRAKTYVDLNDNDLAIADYSRLLVTTATPLPVLKQLAILLKRQGNVDKCIDALRDCIKNDMDEKWCKSQFKIMKKIQKTYNMIKSFNEAEKWLDLIGVTIGEGFLNSLVDPDLKRLLTDMTSKTCYAYGNVFDSI